MKKYLKNISNKKWCEMTYAEKFSIIIISVIFSLVCCFDGVAL